jgi:isopentenyl-diphosphate delta-isomerase
MNPDIILSYETELTSTRKSDHLNICLNQDVESQTTAGWENVYLPHSALPDIDFENIDLSASFLNFQFDYPFLISSMTGGTSDSDKINATLAQFAQAKNIPMGLGSQRYLVERKKSGRFSSLDIRKFAPKAHLWANIGAIQLNYGVEVDDCLWLVEELQAQVLILHLNPLQEAIQMEGDRNFKGLWAKIEKVKKAVKVPVILKETGCGIDQKTAKRAIDIGIDALDIAGLGGTHWGLIEGLRHQKREELGHVFRNWGIPSAIALRAVLEVAPSSYPVIASGGIRTGLDCAKALGMGASLCGLALPFLKAVSAGPEATEQTFKILEESLAIACFTSGASTIKELKTI